MDRVVIERTVWVKVRCRQSEIGREASGKESRADLAEEDVDPDDPFA